MRLLPHADVFPERSSPFIFTLPDAHIDHVLRLGGHFRLVDRQNILVDDVGLLCCRRPWELVHDLPDVRICQENCLHQPYSLGLDAQLRMCMLASIQMSITDSHRASPTRFTMQSTDAL